MPLITVEPSESPSIPRNGLNFWFDASYQSNRDNSQTSSDRSGNYSNFTFSNSVQIDASPGYIKFDGADFINLPINASGVSEATFIYWGEHFSNEISQDLRGIFTNRSPGNNNRFNLLMTSDAGGGILPNRIYYDWATSSVQWNSGIVAPHHGPFMFAISINSTGATLSMIDRDSGIKRTFRRSQGHSAISFTQSVLGISVDIGGFDRFSQQYFSKFFFWTRALSDTEVTRVYNIIKSQENGLDFSSPRRNAYLIRGRYGTTTDTKVQACLSGDKNNTNVNYYSNVPYEFIGTGSFLYTNQGLTATNFGGTFFGFDYVARYAKINKSTGEIQEFGPC